MVSLNRIRLSLLIALALPLIVLAGTWWATARTAQQGQAWLIPITGYDPRDLLRGHFVQYRYDWPMGARSPAQQEQDLTPFSVGYARQLCIEGIAPNIRQVRTLPYGQGPANPRDLTGCAIVARATLGTRREVQGLDTGILFVSQARAITLSRQLADPRLRSFVRVKIRPDGVIRPIDLEFRPRGARQ